MTSETPQPSAAKSEPCPHCHLPAVLPDVCTPALHAVIEANIAKDWNLYGHGYELGKRVGAESVQPSAAPALDVEPIKKRCERFYEVSCVYLSRLLSIGQSGDKALDEDYEELIHDLACDAPYLLAEIERLRSVALDLERLRELAYQEARRQHTNASDDRGDGNRYGHLNRWDVCPHPDCVMVREGVARLRALQETEK